MNVPVFTGINVCTFSRSESFYVLKQILNLGSIEYTHIYIHIYMYIYIYILIYIYIFTLTKGKPLMEELVNSELRTTGFLMQFYSH